MVIDPYNHKFVSKESVNMFLNLIWSENKER